MPTRRTLLGAVSSLAAMIAARSSFSSNTMSKGTIARRFCMRSIGSCTKDDAMAPMDGARPRKTPIRKR